MADDYDILSLAAFLQTDPARIARLVEQGKIPGRRVGGDWRFNPTEITQWLEQRIGESTDSELAKMEDALAQPVGQAALDAVQLAELIPSHAIAIPLAARTKSSVIHAMVELAAQTGWLWDAQRMGEAVRAREEMQSTALDQGVALLHPRRPLPSILERPFIAMGRTETGIPFGCRQLTDLFFLICSVDDRGHLRALARLSRLLADPHRLDALRTAEDVQAVSQLLAQADADWNEE